MKYSRREFLKKLASVGAAAGIANLVRFDPPEEKIEEDLTPYPIKHRLVYENIWGQPYLTRFNVSNVIPSYGLFDPELYVTMRCNNCGYLNLIAYDQEETCWKCDQPL